MEALKITTIFLGLCLVSGCLAQFTYHNDPLSHSFSLKTPGLQQSFTRYFGGKQRANLIQSPMRQQAQLPFQMQQQPQYQSRLRAQPQYQYPQYSQYQQYRQPLAARPQYFQRSSDQPGYPFEAPFEQPLQQESLYSQQSQQIPEESVFSQQAQQQQYVPAAAYSGAQYGMPAAPAATQGLPAYADQLRQGLEAYQQEQQQMQQLLQQQQHQQQQLLLDLYKTPLGQGRAVTNSPGRSQPFYTADSYINFLNKQHQDVFQQQQNGSDRSFGFSPMSSYTEGVPTNAYGGSMAMYSPSSNVSSVSYTSGKNSYSF